jgi:diaminopimelate epimerase
MFSKYQGLGNDFVIVDMRGHVHAFNVDLSKTSEICDRRSVKPDIMLGMRLSFVFIYFTDVGLVQMV